MKLILRMMSENDIDDVVDISTLSFSSPWSKTSYEQELQNPLSKYFVAEIDNKVVGFIGTWIIIDESHITNVAIHPQYRKLGIASQLIEILLSYCSNHGCVGHTLEVRAGNLAAQNLYKKYGFIQNGIRKNYYSDNKEDAILMWLTEKPIEN